MESGVLYARSSLSSPSEAARLGPLPFKEMDPRYGREAFLDSEAEKNLQKEFNLRGAEEKM